MMCDTIEEAAAAFAADKEAYPLAGEFTGYIHYLFLPDDKVIQDEHIQDEHIYYDEIMMISCPNEYNYVPSRLVYIQYTYDLPMIELLHVDAMLPRQEGH